MILANATSTGLALALGAILAYAFPVVASRHMATRIGRVALILAWCLHGLLLVSSLTAGEPRFGFAPALSVTAWLVLTVYAVERQLFPTLQARWALAGLGAIAVLLAVFFPGVPLHAGASAWLSLHWILGIASYGLFAAAVVHAWLMSRVEKQIRLAAQAHTGMPLLTIERITFNLVGLGFLLLTATLIVAWLFRDQLYGASSSGKPIRWDHKSVFSLLSWFTFAALIVGRRLLGWRGKMASRVLYAGAFLLLLAYVGSRFVIEVILERVA